MATTEQENAAQQYIKSLRTPAKRRYAELYWARMKAPGGHVNGPAYHCAYMAAQAVRIHLGDIAPDLKLPY